MSENSLVASRQDSTSFWAGTGLGEDISDLSEAIGQGSWAQGTMAGIGAADAWRSQGQVLTGALESLSSLAEGISSGLGVAATLVQVVHDMVRDLIAEAIGMFFQSVLEEVLAWPPPRSPPRSAPGSPTRSPRSPAA